AEIRGTSRMSVDKKSRERCGSRPVLSTAALAVTFGLGLAAPAAGATLTTFDVEGASATVPVAISSKGAVTGYFANGSVTHGFVRGSDGTIQTFDPKLSHSTYPVSINHKGTVTGYYV